ncbi:hypothetical protein M3194_03860 [Paenibacillus glycanilyticus]|uniref:LLM class flavin-dependent oxidoreductase n=1 Tax=Paenibacillus glycanilyticus TaxID=126569 RepID=UPI00203F7557|nr:LLM class flavin-dependent oxidoreductase [Paenibacillus glycanilyticus]MCM3626503.1 hypothetical protein [Paenibacillus glycanilyticus]
MPIWVGVGGTPQSAINAGRLGLGMNLALLGGTPDRAKPLADMGHHPSVLRVAVSSHGYISETSQQAQKEFYPYYSSYLGQFLKGKMSQAEFERISGPETVLAVGSPEQVIEKILHQHELFRHERFMIQLDIGGMPYSKVAPLVRRELSR